jgi:hypothetical protein
MWMNVLASLVSMVVYAITWRMILVVPVLMTMLGEAATEVKKNNILNITYLSEKSSFKRKHFFCLSKFFF